MSLKHIIKHTETEIVFKCYITESAGGNIDLSVQNDMTKSTQVYVAPTSIPDETGGALVDYTGSRVYITGIWWGLKKDKQLDITRILNAGSGLYHSHYYLINAGYYDFGHSGIADRVYANKDIRLAFDGPGHCILRLRKEGWNPKVETAVFGPYDDVTAVGS
jgi:hypothetical protein